MKADIDFSPLTVLIIDDSRYARSFVKSALHGFGMRNILEAGDGATALEILRDEKVDLILLDQDMSPMTGTDFARFVRSGGLGVAQQVPIIMISGIADMPVVMQARQAGINEFLVKPVSADSLYRRVRSVVTAPRPFVETDTYVGPCRRTVARKPPNGERRVAPPLPRPKPLIEPPAPATAPPAGAALPAGTAAPAQSSGSEKTSRKRFRAGARIFSEGEEGHEAYVVETGRVAIFKEIEGKRVVLGELGPNGIFGEMALIDDEPRMASAEAADDTVCLVIPKTAMKAQLRSTPELAILVLETLLRDIRKLGRELVQARAALKDRRAKA